MATKRKLSADEETQGNDAASTVLAPHSAPPMPSFENGSTIPTQSMMVKDDYYAELYKSPPDFGVLAAKDEDFAQM